MNRLAAETSPYLRQHADNPVDWYPWGAEAFDRARAEDKPLFVSIGYASCHWCHVMAHESFEDPAVAADLATSFVSVKVDREERPDVDAVYMAAVQASTGSGGWPMSVFCTPDGRPFFGGTYFPPTDRHGMPAFRRVLDALADAWTTRRAEVEEQADALGRAVADDVGLVDRLAAGRTARGATPGLRRRPRPDGRRAGRALRPDVGRLRSGARSSPARPSSSCASATTAGPATATPSPWRRRRSTPWPPAASTTTWPAASPATRPTATGWSRTSRRCSPTRRCSPGPTCTPGRLTGDADYRQVVTETLDYVLAELSGPDGGLLLVRGRRRRRRRGRPRHVHPGAGRRGAGGRRASGPRSGGRRLVRRHRRRQLGGDDRAAPPARRPARSGRPRSRTARRALLAAPAGPAAARPRRQGAHRVERHDRRRPGRGGRRHRATPVWAARRKPAASSSSTASGADGRPVAAQSLGERRAGASPADYAWVVDCCTRLGELTGRARWTDRAADAADSMLDLFWDDGVGGLFTTGHDAEALIVRPKDILDGAVPSANAVAAGALLRLGALTGERAGSRRPAERIVAARCPAPRRAAARRRRPGRGRRAGRRRHRGRRRRRPARPARRRPGALAARRRRRLGRAHRVPAVGRPGGRRRLRVPALRLPGAGPRRRYPGRTAGRASPGRRASPGNGGIAQCPRCRTASRSRRPSGRRPVEPCCGTSPAGTASSSRAAPSSTCSCSPAPTRTRRPSTSRPARSSASGSPWPDGHEPDLTAFDVVEATLADDPERDDLAQPEATTVTGLPRQVGTLRGRKVRRLLERLAAPPDGPLLGFPGPSAPYWEFRGIRPSAALVVPTRGPQLIRRPADGSTWVRFGWHRDDVWLPVEDTRAARALDAARRDRLSGKDLATALGFSPHYLLASVSRPRDGHCYKVCSAILPRG